MGNEIPSFDFDGWQGKRLIHGELASIADNLVAMFDGGELVAMAGWSNKTGLPYIESLAAKRSGYGAPMLEYLKDRFSQFALFSASTGIDGFYRDCGLSSSRRGSGYFWWGSREVQ